MDEELESDEAQPECAIESDRSVASADSREARAMIKPLRPEWG
jgi:hypothetical protein